MKKSRSSFNLYKVSLPLGKNQLCHIATLDRATPTRQKSAFYPDLHTKLVILSHGLFLRRTKSDTATLRCYYGLVGQVYSYRKFGETVRVARKCRSIIYHKFCGTLTVDAIGMVLASLGFLNPLLAAFILVPLELVVDIRPCRSLTEPDMMLRVVFACHIGPKP